MSKIEISLDEYKLLKNENTRLYEEVTELKSQNMFLNETINSAKEVMEAVSESGFFERLFNWGSLETLLKEFLITLENKRKNK